jgi:SAM-dependent methyltransferase
MTDGKAFSYQGHELDIFAGAQHWKSYWASRIRRWIHGDILEVGAGLGANTALLQNEEVRSWRCIEPDPELVRRLEVSVASLKGCSVITGTLESVAGCQFDSILYIDVLEHIKADRDELATAADLLREGGYIVVVAPAHQFLFSEFDASIGHYRRYDKNLLKACSPASCHLETMFYLDSIGLFASAANRIILRQSQPTAKQIQTWDRYMVPLSRVIDPLLLYGFGKTICGIWTRSRVALR